MSDYKDIELKRSNYPKPENPVYAGSDEDIDLTDEQQDLLKQLMCDANVEQLRCMSDCIQCMIDDMRKHNDNTVTVDDFEKAKSRDGEDMKKEMMEGETE